jgi:hypothetical protein
MGHPDILLSPTGSLVVVWEPVGAGGFIVS